MRDILLIRLRELGDTLLATPLIRQLNRLYPEATIDVVCEPRNACILEHHPRVNRLYHLPRSATFREFLSLATELRSRRYDLVVDVQSLPKTAVLARLTGGRRRVGFRRRGIRNRLCYTHPYQADSPYMEYAALQNLRLLQDDRIDATDLQMDFYISEPDREDAEQFCRNRFQPPVAAIATASRFDERLWTVDKFAELADRLSDRGFQPFLVYGPGEEGKLALEVASKMRREALVDYPMMGVTVLKGILQQCALFVGVDGGPKHIAAAAGIPTLSLFGVVHPEGYTDPTKQDQRFVTTCSDARPIPTRGICTPYHTLKEIPVDAVWSELESMIADGQVVAPGQGTRQQPAA